MFHTIIASAAVEERMIVWKTPNRNAMGMHITCKMSIPEE